MLTRQKLWVPVTKHSPKHFIPFSNNFMTLDKTSRRTLETVNVKPSDMLVFPVPDPRQQKADKGSDSSGGDGEAKQVSALLAVSFRVTESVCDGEVAAGDTAHSHARLSDGFLMNLVDTVTSFHIMERLIPRPLVHYSVNITNQIIMPAALVPGTDITMVCTMEKLGKRLAYTSADFYLDQAHVDEETARAEANITCLADVQRVLSSRYRKAAHATHVKSIAERKLSV